MKRRAVYCDPASWGGFNATGSVFTCRQHSAAVQPKLDVFMREFRVQDPGLYDAENRSETELEGENELITPTLPRQ